MKRIIVVGGGGHSISCIDVIESQNKFKIIGIIEENKKIKKIYNYKVIGSDSDLKQIFKNCKNLFIGIGQIRSYKIRKSIYNKAAKIGYNIPTIISPFSIVSKKARISNTGTIIMHNAVVNSGAFIDKNVILNSNSLIEHGVSLSQYCHVSTGAIINGDVKVDEGTFIGSGSILKEGISIGKNCIIGAGITIKKNIPSNSIVK